MHMHTRINIYDTPIEDCAVCSFTKVYANKHRRRTNIPLWWGMQTTDLERVRNVRDCERLQLQRYNRCRCNRSIRICRSWKARSLSSKRQRGRAKRRGIDPYPSGISILTDATRRRETTRRRPGLLRKIGIFFRPRVFGAPLQIR